MMRVVTCWRLRRQLTCYSDGELAAEERLTVDRHLAGCEACRRRVRIELAVRRTLLDRTARANSTAWLARPALPAHPSTARWYLGKAAAVAAVAIVLVFWGNRWFGAVPVEAVGMVSDSHCNGVHRPAEAPDAAPRACIEGCLRKGARYVFVAGQTIYTIRNPDSVDLMATAGHTIQVSGTARGGQLTLARIDLVR